MTDIFVLSIIALNVSAICVGAALVILFLLWRNNQKEIPNQVGFLEEEDH